MNHAKVSGSHVNLDHFASFKTLKDAKANGPQIFDHLSGDDKDKAYDELWKALKSPADQTTTQVPGPEAASAAPSAE